MYDRRRRSSRARGEEEVAGRRKEAERRSRKCGSSRGGASFFKFLGEWQNGQFTKLLGASTILLGAPSMSPLNGLLINVSV